MKVWPQPDAVSTGSDAWGSSLRFAEGSRQAILSPGAQLGSGRFAVQRLLGRGAMGLVYAATDTERAKLVALKTLRLTSADSEHALKQEFRSLRDVTHPNLVRLHELFVTEDEAFFTMDLIDGEPFDTFVQRAMSNPDALQIDLLKSVLEQLMAAVEALHAAGKLHRDLKPANVLVDRNGRLHVLDFGLVLDFPPAGAAEVLVGELNGTPRYMAPELFRWQPPSAKSDWYSVGVMLYEGLTGSTPAAMGSIPSAWLPELPGPPSRTLRTLPVDIDALCLSLLEPDPERRGDAHTIKAVLGPRQAKAVPLSAAPGSNAFVGRDAELHVLERAYSVMQAQGQTRAVFVSGPSGMGKTCVVERFCNAHRVDSTVLVGRCHEHESVSHKGFDDIIDKLVRELQGRTDEQVLELVPPGQARDLLRLFPSLARVSTLAGFVTEPEIGDPGDQRLHAYRALRAVLVALSLERPLIVVFDDLQWGDIDSAKLLFEVFSSPEPMACLLVFAFRSDEVRGSVCLERLLVGSRCLADAIDVEQLEISRLDEASARVLARSLLRTYASHERTTEAQVQALVHEAGGSPLLLHELALHQAQAGGTEAGGARLADIVQARLLAVSLAARRVFALVCVAGVPIREIVLCRALDRLSVDEEVIALEAQRLVRARTSRSPDALEPAHDGIREVQLKALGVEELRDLHRELARSYSQLMPPDVEALARHTAGAALHAEATEWAGKAAARARDRLAFERAVEFRRMALVHNQDPAQATLLQAQLGDALADAGRAGEAAPLFIQLAAQSAPREALAYRQRAAEQWLVSGRIAEGLSVLRAVFSELGMKLPESRFAALTQVAVSKLVLKRRGYDFVAHSESELPAVELLRIDACRACWVFSFLSAIHGAALQGRYLRLALNAGEPYRLALGFAMEAIVCSSEGKHEQSRALHQRGEALSATIENPHAMAFQHLSEGYCGYLSGEWHRCTVGAERADEAFTRHCRGSTWELNTLRFFWGNALVQLGRYRELRRRVPNWLRDSEDREDLYAQAAFRLIGTRSLHLADDQPERGLADLQIALSEWTAPGLGVHRFLAEIARAQIFLYQGEPQLARQAMGKLQKEFRWSTLSHVQMARIHVHQHVGFSELAFAAAQSGKARAHAVERAQRHQQKLVQFGVHWASALARYMEGQVLWFQGQDERAEVALRDAVQQLNDRGMRFYAAAAEWALGRLISGTEGQELVSHAALILSAQGVRAPHKLLRVLGPGL